VHVFSFAGEPTDPFERVDMLGLILIEGVEPAETPHHA
jgi:hypothetical protein